MTESGFSKAQSNNLPRLDQFMVARFFANNELFSSAEIRGVKLDSKMIYTVPSDQFLNTGDLENLEIVEEPQEYCQFQHRTSKKCLAVKGPGKENANLLMEACAKDLPQMRYQTFHYDPKEKLLSIKNIRQRPGTSFVNICVTLSAIPQVSRCIKPAKRIQTFYYTKDFRFYNVLRNRTKSCITASNKESRPLMKDCLNKKFKSQQFRCLKVNKSRLFKPHPDLHKICKALLSIVTDSSLRNRTDTTKKSDENLGTVDSENQPKQDKQTEKSYQKERGEENEKIEEKEDRQTENAHEKATVEENKNTTEEEKGKDEQNEPKTVTSEVDEEEIPSIANFSTNLTGKEMKEFRHGKIVKHQKHKKNHISMAERMSKAKDRVLHKNQKMRKLKPLYNDE